MDTLSSYAAKSPSIVSPFLTYFSRTNGNNYAFVALFALLALLAVFFVARSWGRFRPNVPFALEDEFPSRKERVQQYVRNSREVLAKGYSKFTLERYTKVGALPAWSIKLFSAKFNPALVDSYAEIFQNMVGEHIANLLPPAHEKDWASINVWSSIIPLITKSNVRGFLGSDAAKDDVFLDIAGTFIINQIVYSIGAKQWPSFLLPIVHKYLPGFPGLAEQYSNGAKVVLRQMKNKKANGLKPLSDPPSVFDYVNDDGQYLDDLQLQMNIQMPLCAASIHTTTSTVVQCLYDLASRPEYLPALRQEIQEVTNEHGDILTRRVASKLEKMDSFIKEVQRFCSPDLTTFQRKATGPVTLSNGFHLPKGARIEVATGAINADAALYNNPSEFDGLRFYKKRQTEEARSKYQVLSVSKEDLVWGYGRAACPGRFLADMLIKMILVEILKRYDIKMPDGQGRYENMEVQGQTLPNEQGEILIRERD
ncbi:Cytochrome P450 monooxygenase BOA4 [Colletotrichum siamense]|uniref:Cytochrome P450 monooxygenase BOA4 n=1 Tax=Colletotrichum siamense TaxID=690259 RepID=UPI0018729F6D|nr:Cytochrome P450 monooxygenase BOA4 [Colletotrichum siamense]KAF5497283.1 Cytochrome P450 monooxygenase BOA4 [Colletotrichum siamense]